VSEFEFAKPQWVYLAWAAPLVIGLVIYGNARRRGRLAVFGVDPARSAAWLGGVRRRRILRAVLLACALGALTIAAIQPRTNPKRQPVKSASRDLAICLDVSRSMLATDVAPNRLERAKLELSRLAKHLAGDRVGLVVFAGNSVIACPLTTNYSYFNSVLRNVSTTSAGQGGTRIGDAIRTCLRDQLGLESRPTTQASETDPNQEPTFEPELPDNETFADILLITDGEDHDSYPSYAAKQAAALNVGLYTIGLGDPAGSEIMIETSDGSKQLLRYQDKPVISKLDEALLKEMALAGPRGAYLPVGTANFDLVEFYQNTIVAQQPRRKTMTEYVQWTEVFQPAVLVGLALLLACLLMPERPARLAGPAAKEAA